MVEVRRGREVTSSREPEALESGEEDESRKDDDEEEDEPREEVGGTNTGGVTINSEAAGTQSLNGWGSGWVSFGVLAVGGRRKRAETMYSLKVGSSEFERSTPFWEEEDEPEDCVSSAALMRSIFLRSASRRRYAFSDLLS